MKRVLVTGACGNIGANVVDLLLERGYAVRAVDLDSAGCRKTAARWAGRVEMRFGSICDEALVSEVVSGVDHVIHLAAMVPPGTDVDQAAGYAVNVVATRAIIAACEAQARPPRLTFTSTAAIWGRNAEVDGPRRADEAIAPSDNYSRQKAECEAMLRSSSLQTVIFRIAMTPPVAPGALSPFVFDMHPDMRVEFTHPKDQALGIVNSLLVDEVAGRTLCLGGGSRNRYRYREFMNMAFGAMGIPPLPRSAFGDALFLTDWVDSEASQAILDYQRRGADEYFEEVSAELGAARHVMKYIGPTLTPLILAHSRHHALVEGKKPRLPDAYRAITTVRRALKAAKSYL
ncbi:MAG: NAD(P)-dependent oxidoreductase [Deltaproteobacteria bacterium]|nr:NAD(P)-dependent oxidoreductase [Deltaproteobacteria bacterium]NNK08280.1 NAD(P)-dependent oxidoreductase [Myxococcales bacterium]MBT8463227.1 NAD(P)-dependent oxidoreductase [Deltaproteobacteria bacterium]MBT8482695.1 NAD(P)-dependent oxidoreductase [Deltaproteobacteria bacterium]NNK44152.1 NAD(P)-dependent oxidoreductase [Myxococcales bacterium]